MLTGRRFKVKFAPDQEVYADQVAGVCRAVWNTGLAQRRMYRRDRRWINYAQQAKELADAKSHAELGWLAAAPSHTLQQTLMDLDKACRVQGTWRIRFRAKTRWSPSFRFPVGKHMQVVKISKRWGQVNLPKFGQVTFRRTRDLGGIIRSATITRESVHGDWYISFLVEDGVQTPAPDMTKPAIGIDRGVKVALALSDGRMLDEQFTTDREQIGMAGLQRRAARQHGPRIPGTRGRAGRRAPSKRWLATQARIAKQLAKQRRRRDDFTTKTARTLTETHSLIVIEDLQVAQMTKRAAPKPDPDHPGVFLPNRAAQKKGLNRAILAKGWGKFRLALQHKARYTGTEIIHVPAAFTSQRCHQCGHTAKENRESQAVFRCIMCGHTANADTNAALNILAAGHAVSGRASPDLSGGVNQPSSFNAQLGIPALQGGEDVNDHVGATRIPAFSGDGAVKARVAKGWSQGRLAAMMDVSVQAVSSWERSINTPSPPYFIRLVQALSVRPGDLLNVPRVDWSLIDHRAAAGLHQQDVPKLAGISNKRLSNIELAYERGNEELFEKLQNTPSGGRGKEGQGPGATR